MHFSNHCSVGICVWATSLDSTSAVGEEIDQGLGIKQRELINNSD